MTRTDFSKEAIALRRMNYGADTLPEVRERISRFLSICERKGWWRSGYRHLRGLLHKLPKTRNNKVRLPVLLATSRLLWRLGQFDAARVDATFALHIAKARALRAESSQALHMLGLVARRQGNLNKSLDYFTLSLGMRRTIRDQSLVASSLNNIGLVHHHLGNCERAISFFFRSKRIYGDLGRDFDIAWVVNNLALVSLQQGRVSEALHAFTTSYRSFSKAEDVYAISHVLQNHGRIALVQRMPMAAQAWLRLAISMKQQMGDVFGVALCKTWLAAAALQKNDFKKAFALLRATVRTNKKLGAKLNESLSFALMAWSAFLSGSRQIAEAHLERTLSLSAATGEAEHLFEAAVHIFGQSVIDASK